MSLGIGVALFFFLLSYAVLPVGHFSLFHFRLPLILSCRTRSYSRPHLISFRPTKPKENYRFFGSQFRAFYQNAQTHRLMHIARTMLSEPKDFIEIKIFHEKRCCCCCLLLILFFLNWIRILCIYVDQRRDENHIDTNVMNLRKKMGKL